MLLAIPWYPRPSRKFPARLDAPDDSFEQPVAIVFSFMKTAHKPAAYLEL